MLKIIVSYRRSDSAAITGRIFDRLVARYGDEAVFMDIDDIPFGIDFRQHIQNVINEASLVLVVIGQRWLGVAADGKSRIADPADPVRVEVEAALKKGIALIPVLVDSATMPSARDLPPSIEELAYINAAPVDSGRDFRAHMDRLIRSIDDRLGLLPGASAPAATGAPEPASVAAAGPVPSFWSAARLSGLAAGLVVVIALGVLLPRLWPASAPVTTPTRADTKKTSEPVQFPPAPSPQPNPNPPADPAPPRSYRVLASVSEGKLNMRSGPGTNYPLVVSIPAGSTGITLGTCRMPDDRGTKPWCEAKWKTYAGWVSSCCVVDEKTGEFPK